MVARAAIVAYLPSLGARRPGNVSDAPSRRHLDRRLLLCGKVRRFRSAVEVTEGKRLDGRVPEPRGLLRRHPRRFPEFAQDCAALLVSNWIVWIPVTVAVYLFPLPLQIRLVGLAVLVLDAATCKGPVKRWFQVCYNIRQTGVQVMTTACSRRGFLAGAAALAGTVGCVTAAKASKGRCSVFLAELHVESGAP